LIAVNPQLPLGLSPRAGGRFENFFIGENQLLANIAREIAERGSEQQFGIWGATGAGKSHLLNAICHAAFASDRTAAYVSLTDSIDKSPSLLRGLESVDVIAIDNLDVLHNCADWQSAVFDLVNRVRQSGSSIVTASQKNPSALDLLPDLVSRLVWGPVMRLLVTRDLLVADALAERCRALGLTMPAEVVHYLLSRYPREIGNLFAALTALDHASLVEQRRLTVPFVKLVLAEKC
jgi:DnaA family protein